MLRESITISWRNITQNKFRTFLTVLGIIIGVTAIISLVTILQGVIDEVNRQFDSVGANTIIVSATGTPLKQGLTDHEISELVEIDGIVGWTPSVSNTASIHAHETTLEKVNIKGINEVYFARNHEMVVAGRGINYLDIESKNTVCVINTDMAQKLFLGENPIGKSIVIYGVSYKVIGLLDETAGLNSVMTVMSGVGDSVMIPYRNVLSMNGTDRVYALEVYTTEDADVLGTVDQMETYLNQVFNYKDDSYSLIEMENLLDMMKDLQGMMRAMLVGIASISLLVGGIGIMNMMLVSVTERTTEIGLRKALGAEPRRIQIQFLTEAIILSLMGGIMGVIVGLTLAYIAAIVIGYPFELNIFAIVLGTGFSAAVGIIFGFAPAKKASELNPIDALRSI